MRFPLPGPEAPHLLIVDDERPLRVAVQRWFSRRGWRCAEAGTLAEAEEFLFAAGAVAPDVILCDLNLPDGTAHDLLERIEREQPALAVRMILATGDVFTAEVARRLRTIGCRTLPKPFDLADVEAAAKSTPHLQTSA